MDGVDGRLNARWNLLHVDIRGRSRARVPHDTLNVFDRPLLLCEGCNRSADNLERQLGQLEFTSDLVKNALAKVVRVEEASIFLLEHEVIRRQRDGLSVALRECLSCLRFTFQTPCLQLVSKLSWNMNHGEALLRLPPIPDLAFVDSLRDRERRSSIVEALPSECEQLARTQSVRHSHLDLSLINRIRENRS